MPPDDAIVTCLVFTCDDKGAAYIKASYHWWDGKWWPRPGSPKLCDDRAITHWLDDPEVYPPLPDDWPDCDISDVKSWLKPYLERKQINDAA